MSNRLNFSHLDRLEERLLDWLDKRYSRRRELACRALAIRLARDRLGLELQQIPHWRWGMREPTLVSRTESGERLEWGAQEFFSDSTDRADLIPCLRRTERVWLNHLFLIVRCPLCDGLTRSRDIRDQADLNSILRRGTEPWRGHRCLPSYHELDPNYVTKGASE